MEMGRAKQKVYRSSTLILWAVCLISLIACQQKPTANNTGEDTSSIDRNEVLQQETSEPLEESHSHAGPEACSVESTDKNCSSENNAATSDGVDFGIDGVPEGTLDQIGGISGAADEENDAAIDSDTDETQDTKPDSDSASETAEEEAGVFCLMDAKQCPDGSFVSRQGPNCEFAACPGEEKVKK